MYKVIVIDDEMLVRRGIVMETDWQALNWARHFFRLLTVAMSM